MSRSEAKTGRAQSGDVGLFFRRFGSPGATPVLIQHGLSFFSYDWIEAASALAADREVVAMDMRGFGDSDSSPRGDYSLAAFAGDTIALLDHLGWRQAVLIGHSMGGRNATFCTAEHPGRVKALVLVDYSPENAPAGSKRVRAQVAGTPDTFESVDAAMLHFKNDPDEPAKRARFEAYLRKVEGGYAIKRDPYFREQFRRALETGQHPKLGVDMWQMLGRLQCPTLVIRGARSDMFAPETVARVRAANALIQVVEVDAGHNIAVENRDGFLSAVRPFLQQVEAHHEQDARA
ncbi:MAG: alpha/beta hydrolase [Betaproteobacteria bacterium]|jgi:pimeloyl-ACP methyl ester carboxylesterase|nr:alpha/beta hydrolase [Betaproteobacteria bacterium]